ncbi:MAG TPA: DUF5683 domain-containing protein [Flavisolibacter sp.]|nr:DUF5683 domain-containing protein [Flavisolibacter sp.]
MSALINHCIYKNYFLLLILFVLQVPAAFAQVDSTKQQQVFDTTKPRILVDTLPKLDSPLVVNKQKVDSVIRKHSPKKAAIRSALIPGWGQAYNKRYWKIPIVYGALGVSGGIFLFNLKNYRELKQAYIARNRALPTSAGPGDSTEYRKLERIYQVLDINAIRTYRDEYRRNIDYSALFFILLWGLNVVDATVDAHLRSFDVTPDLSFRFRIGTSEMAGTTGLSLILAFK